MALAVASLLCPAVPARADGPPGSYVVQAGDTLTSIAQTVGVSMDRLVELNALASADAISVGEVLVISEPAPSQVVYRVESGDTLSGIARGFGIDAGAIATANGLDDPDTLATGAELIIPDPDPAGTGPAVQGTAAKPRLQPPRRVRRRSRGARPPLRSQHPRPSTRRRRPRDLLPQAPGRRMSSSGATPCIRLPGHSR